MDYCLPETDAVHELLAPFVGEDCTVSATDSNDISDPYVGVFIDREDKPVAVGVCDVAFAAYSGASFSMIPKDVAKEMIDDGEVSFMVRDNLNEIMNIFSILLMNEETPHLRLGPLLRKSEVECWDDIEAQGSRAMFNIDVPNYGVGSVGFVVT